MAQPLISVVIPVYNVEPYLRECIDSVLNQTYTNLEVYLVNDGSTDGSPAICKKYEVKDKRIKVINQVNQGLSEARNVTLDKIKGEYVTFIDSDDFVSDKFIEYLYNLAISRNADIVSCGWYDHINGISQPHVALLEEKELSPKEAIRQLLEEKGFTTSAWGKLFKTSLFENIRFPKGQLYEDLPTIYKAIDKVQKVIYSTAPHYYYRMNPESIMNSKFKPKNMDFIKSHEEIAEYVAAKYPNLLEYAKARETRYAVAFLYRAYSQDFKDAVIINQLRDIIKKNLGTFIKSKYSFNKKLFSITSLLPIKVQRIIARRK